MVRTIVDARGRSPMCRQSNRPSLGGEAGGRSPGFISLILRPRSPHYISARYSRLQNEWLWPIDRAGHLVPFRRQPLRSVESAAGPFGAPTIHQPYVLPPRRSLSANSYHAPGPYNLTIWMLRLLMVMVSFVRVMSVLFYACTAGIVIRVPFLAAKLKIWRCLRRLHFAAQKLRIYLGF